MNIGLKEIRRKYNNFYVLFLNSGDKIIQDYKINTRLKSLLNFYKCNMVFKTINTYGKYKLFPKTKYINSQSYNPHQGFVAYVKDKLIYFREDLVFSSDGIWMQKQISYKKKN